MSAYNRSGDHTGRDGPGAEEPLAVRGAGESGNRTVGAQAGMAGSTVPPCVGSRPADGSPGKATSMRLSVSRRRPSLVR